MKGNVRFVEHQIISELRMRKEYRIADMAEGAFRYYRWQMEMLREKNKNQLLKVFISDDGGEIKQLYNGEEVEKIVKEREEYKHRAEVAERALRNITERASCNICDNFSCRYYEGINYDYNAEECIKWWLAQAEKELSEEEKE